MTGGGETCLSLRALTEEFQADGIRVGHAALDAEHQALVDGLAALWLARADGATEAALFDRMLAIIRGESDHFRHEEAVLEALDVPDVEAHRAEHARLIADAEVCAEAVRAGKLAVPAFVKTVSSQFLEHLVRYDLAYSDHIAAANG